MNEFHREHRGSTQSKRPNDLARTANSQGSRASSAFDLEAGAGARTNRSTISRAEFASKRLGEIAAQLTRLDSEIKLGTSQKQGSGVKRRSLRNIKDRANILANQFREYANITSADFETLGLAQADFATLNIDFSLLTKIEAEIEANEIAADAQIATDVEAKTILEAEQRSLGASLNGPQQNYQRYLTDLKIWEGRRDFIQGSNSPSAENLNGLRAHLSQLDQLPTTLFIKKGLRAAITRDIYGVLSAQRSARAALFSPLQRVIEANALIRDNYKLQFQATLHGSPAAISSRLFDFVKRAAGELRGEEESDAAVRSRFDKYDFTTPDHAVAFADDIIDMIESVAKQGGYGIRTQLRRDKQPIDVMVTYLVSIFGAKIYIAISRYPNRTIVARAARRASVDFLSSR